MEEKIRKIFSEIDLAILENICEKPKTIEESNFIKRYKKIKEKYSI